MEAERSEEVETDRREEVETDRRKKAGEADRRKKAGEADRGELVTPSLVSASAAAMSGLAVIIAAAHLLTRLCEYRERSAFLF